MEDERKARAFELTRGAIADFLRLTLETIYRQLSGLRAKNVIAISAISYVEVPDSRTPQEECCLIGSISSRSGTRISFSNATWRRTVSKNARSM